MRLVYKYNFRGLIIFIKLLGINGIAKVKIPGQKQQYFLRRGTSDIAVFNSIHAFNEFKYNVNIPQNGVILDCGANIGISTTYFAEKYPHALIIALEPSSSNFELLQKNTHVYENVVCIQAAIWSSSCELFLQNPQDEDWSFRFAQERSNKKSKVDSVLAISISDLMQRYNLQHIDLMKIDIEGGEKALFSGDNLEWVRSVKTYIIELHDSIVPGCSCAFYRSLHDIDFNQAILGEKTLVTLIS